MTNLSMTQVLEIWDELRDCLEGSNGYGGDTAEIYAYRLTKHHIPRPLGAEGYGDDVEDQIAASLTNLLRHFCLQHNCTAEIECSGVPHYSQVRIMPRPRNQGGSVPPFSHRAHIKIVRKDQS